jgi:hypothetical protein
MNALLIVGRRSDSGSATLQEQEEYCNAQQGQDSSGARTLLRDCGTCNQLNEKRNCDAPRYTQEQTTEPYKGRPSLIMSDTADSTQPFHSALVSQVCSSQKRRRQCHEKDAHNEDATDQLVVGHSTDFSGLSQFSSNRVTHGECEIGSESSQCVCRPAHCTTRDQMTAASKRYAQVSLLSGSACCFATVGVGCFFSECNKPINRSAAVDPCDSENSASQKSYKRSNSGSPVLVGKQIYGSLFVQLVGAMVRLHPKLEITRCLRLFDISIFNHESFISNVVSPLREEWNDASMGATVHRMQWQLIFREKGKCILSPKFTPKDTIRRYECDHVKRAFGLCASLSIWFGVLCTNDELASQATSISDAIQVCVRWLETESPTDEWMNEWNGLQRAAEALSHPSLQWVLKNAIHIDSLQKMRVELEVVRHCFWPSRDSTLQPVDQAVIVGSCMCDSSSVSLDSTQSQMQMHQLRIGNAVLSSHQLDVASMNTGFTHMSSVSRASTSSVWRPDVLLGAIGRPS